jgi:hypothetical protein
MAANASNQTMKLTIARYAFTLSVTTHSPLRCGLGAGDGSLSYSR